MPNIDLSSLTFAQFAIALFVVMIVDFLFGVVTALAHGTFSIDKLLNVVETHLLPRVFPIGATGLIAWAVPQAANAHDVIWLSALGLLAAYMLETLASVAGNVSAGNPASNPPTN